MREALKRLTVALNARRMQVDARNTSRATAVAAARLHPGQLSGMGDVAAFVSDRCRSWLGPDDIRNGRPGLFDACDVLAWCAVAERAGVAAVPAREIARLSETEMGFLSGPATDAHPAVAKRAAQTLASLPEADLKALGAMLDTKGAMADPAELVERLHACLDGLPEGMMVRHHRAGSSLLKSFAGAGIGADGSAATMGAGLEVGPGWVRNGNRRRIDASDDRFRKAQVDGYEGDAVFVARPWMKASRLLEADDPNRAGTPAAGRGEWPAEWRVFIENGQVTGVSSYYCWAGAISPLDAYMACQARAAAEAMMLAMEQASQCPDWMNLALLHGNPLEHTVPVRERFPSGGAHCTLDFMETTEGLLFLEGGPPFTPFGGGFPCAFAMSGVRETPRGVAFRIPPEVSLTDTKTWGQGIDPECWLDWDAAECLAAKWEPADQRTLRAPAYGPSGA